MLAPVLAGAITDTVTLAVLTYGTVSAVRIAVRLHTARPRWCSCSHGPGEHGDDGCKGYRVVHLFKPTDDGPARADKVFDCRCSGFDAAGPRAPR
jgi:hypothetical protein